MITGIFNRQSTISLVFSILILTLRSFGLDCEIVASYDRAIPDKWAHSPSNFSVFLVRSDTVYAGLPWGIYTIFKGYSRNDLGKVNISFSYRILKPNGTLYRDSSRINAVTDFTGKDSGMLLSRYVPVILFSGKDPIGKYRIIVTATDGTAKSKTTRECTVILSNYPRKGVSSFDEISFNVWVHSYCIEPNPGRAIEAFYYFIESDLSNNDAMFWPVFYFFQCLFSDNPFLVEKLCLNFPACSQRLQEYTVFLLRSIQVKRTPVNYAIPDSLWKKFDKVAEPGFYDPFTYAFKVQSNRFIEFGFYYYGRYSMIRFLIDCLGLNTSVGYDAFLAGCNAYSDGCEKHLAKETALQFYSDAGKILAKIYSKHALAHAYCDFAIEKDKIGIQARGALKEIIASSKR
jgi:hypothetical protein